MSADQEDLPKYDSSWVYRDELTGEAPEPEPEQPGPHQERLRELPVLPKFPRKKRDESELAPGRRPDLKGGKGGFRRGL